MSTKPAKLFFSKMAEYRQSRGENQVLFWRRFGVTQSGGSRYESGRKVPRAVKLLVVLADIGVLTDDVLEKARKALAKAG